MTTRKAAIVAKLTRYNGKVRVSHPELNGLRYVSNFGCITCALDTVKRYQEANRGLMRKRNKAYRLANPEKIQAWHRDWRAKNAAHDSARKQSYNERNSARVKARYKKYYIDNYPKMLAKRNKQHATKLQRTPKWLDVDDLWLIEQAYELSAMRTKMLGFAWHVDHVIPLRGTTVSGLHVPTNLCVVPAVVNLRKGNRYAE